MREISSIFGESGAGEHASDDADRALVKYPLFDIQAIWPQRSCLQKILRQERIHHPVFWIELSADLFEKRQSAAERLLRIVSRYVACLIEYRYATPVTSKVTEVDGKVFPAFGLGRYGAKCNHRFVETR